MNSHKGRTVKIFLSEGQANGILIAEIINWTGKVIVSPRSKLADLSHRKELRKPGTYMLVGSDLDDPFRDKVYIGSSDDVWERLKQHNVQSENNSSKEFWEKTIAIISKDMNLTKGHVLYLESRFIEISKSAKRANLANDISPGLPSLPESDVADMEYFVEQVQMLLPVLGFSFARLLPLKLPERSTKNLASNQQGKKIEEALFFLDVNGVKAKAQELDGEFIVLKDSTFYKKNAPSLRPAHQERREKLKEEGKLVDSDSADFWMLVEDIPFETPSTAANIVAGTRLNGRTSWRTIRTQETYAQWQESQIQKAEAQEVKSTPAD